MMRSPYVYIPDVHDRYSRIILPGNSRSAHSLEKLREYTYTYWMGDGRYYIKTGWGQDAGRVETEQEARAYCQYVRDAMQFKAVVTADGLRVPVGTECDILDFTGHWDSDVPLAYRGSQFYAGKGQWRFKIVWKPPPPAPPQSESMIGEGASPVKRRVFCGGQRAIDQAANVWMIDTDEALQQIDAALRERMIPMMMELEDWQAWLEEWRIV